MNYTRKMARMMIEDKAPKAAKEIGFQYDEGVAEQIEITLYEEFRIRPSLSIEVLEDCIDRTIDYWKKDTKRNYPEQCAL